MITLCRKYAAKLERQGLARQGSALVGGLDAELEWNRQDWRTDVLTEVFPKLSINSLVFAEPPEPYATIINYLASRSTDVLQPEDTETRTFLHDIPICKSFDADSIAFGLGQRKVVLIPGHGVVASGTVTPEQGFVFYSSALFACFVLFFSDCLRRARSSRLDDETRRVYYSVVALLPEPKTDGPSLGDGPFQTARDVLHAMAEAGRAVVDYGLVDSFFGNISYRLGGVVHISQTGSSLDELEGCIDPCPLDGSTTHGITASSELSAHEDVYRRSENLCILHGHPRFSVILSMDCAAEGCPNRGRCHVACDQCRTVEGVPIVPGEVGTGETGLCNTLPPAIVDAGTAIVHGHGVFAAGESDFRQAFDRLLLTELRCRAAYFERMRELLAVEPESQAHKSLDERPSLG